MSVAKSSFLFAAGTLISRVSGLLRDVVVVGVFGASTLLDAFIVAFRIPNLLREMLAEGALGSSFTKVFSSLKDQDRTQAYQLLFDALVFFFMLSCIVCTLGVIWSPELVQLMTLKVPSAEQEVFIFNTIGLTRILFPYLGLMMVSSVVMGALHERGSFFLSAVSPIAFNMGFILGAWLLADWFAAWSPSWMVEKIGDPRIVGLAVGVLLGGLAQLIMQFSVLIRVVLSQLSSRAWHWPWTDDLKKVLKLMIPASIAAGAGPINVFINTNFATALGEGAVSWLNFAFRLLQLPIGLFGVAVGVAVLPTLSRSLQRSQQVVTSEVNRHLQSAVELVSWLMLLCFAYLAANHQSLIQLLFQHGQFSESDSVATSQALYAYSFGVLGYGLIKVLTSFYYAVERTDFAMKVSLFSILINFVGNYLLVQKIGHIGLAATSSITLSINALILFFGLSRFQVKMEKKALMRSAFLAGGAVIVSIALMGLINSLFDTFLDFGWPTKVTAAVKLLLNGISLVGVFGMLATICLKVSPKELVNQFKGRLQSRKLN